MRDRRVIHRLLSTLLIGLPFTSVAAAQVAEHELTTFRPLHATDHVFVALTPADVLHMPEGQLSVLPDNTDWSTLAQFDLDFASPITSLPATPPSFRLLSPADPSAPVTSLVEVLRSTGSLGQRAGGEAFWVPGLRWSERNVELGVGLPIGVNDHADDWGVVGVISFRF